MQIQFLVPERIKFDVRPFYPGLRTFLESEGISLLDDFEISSWDEKIESLERTTVPAILSSLKPLEFLAGIARVCVQSSVPILPTTFDQFIDCDGAIHGPMRLIEETQQFFVRVGQDSLLRRVA